MSLFTWRISSNHNSQLCSLQVKDPDTYAYFGQFSFCSFITNMKMTDDYGLTLEFKKDLLFKDMLDFYLECHFYAYQLHSKNYQYDKCCLRISGENESDDINNNPYFKDECLYVILRQEYQNNQFSSYFEINTDKLDMSRRRRTKFLRFINATLSDRDMAFLLLGMQRNHENSHLDIDCIEKGDFKIKEFPANSKLIISDESDG